MLKINYLKHFYIEFFTALLLPIIVIVAYQLNLQEGTIMMNKSIDTVFMYIVPIFICFFVPLGYYLYYNRKKNLKNIENIDLRIEKFVSITRIKLGIFAGLNIFTIFSFGFTIMLIATMFQSHNKTANILDLDISFLKSYSIKIFSGRGIAIGIIAIVFVGFTGYQDFNELISNRVILPTPAADSGFIKQHKYYNGYLNWTFKIPKGYKEVKNNKFVFIDNGETKHINIPDKPKHSILLLSLSNYKSTYLMCYLHPTVLYPKIKTEKDYLDMVDGDMKKSSLKKRKTGHLIIGKEIFTYNYYKATNNKKAIHSFAIIKYTKDYIIEIGMISLSRKNGSDLIKKLKKSKLKLDKSKHIYKKKH